MSISRPSHGQDVFPDSVVASIQMEPRIGETADNVARSIRMIEEAASSGAALVVLPELANTGYVFASRAEAFDLAEGVPEGASASAWIEAAKRLNIHLVAGIAERDGDRLFNSALVAGPRGHIGVYRKLHLWATSISSSRPATQACRCSTPRSDAWPLPSATTAGSRRSIGCSR